MRKLYLKRDETSVNNPDIGQVDIGELVMNSKTGRLYTKLTDGSLVEFIGQKVCYGPIPDIQFRDISNFCCFGDTMYVELQYLQPSPKTYTYQIEELTSNNPTMTIHEANYTNTIFSSGFNIPSGQSITLRKASIPIDIHMSGSNPISIFKFTVLSDNMNITEKTFSISCNTC